MPKISEYERWQDKQLRIEARREEKEAKKELRELIESKLKAEEEAIANFKAIVINRVVE